MKRIDATTKGGQAALARFDRRAESDPSVRASVTAILDAVRRRGDAAVVEFTRKFDRASIAPGSLGVPIAGAAAAWAALDVSTRDALKAAHSNIAAFARRSLRRSWMMRNAQGAHVGENYQGFERVGLYVPGGTAPLVSTALMTVTLAKVAGCGEIVVCTPCGPDGSVNAALLAALHIAGASEIFRIGGVQAIGAMAFGTGSIRPVAKIFGPGNQWVIEAKRQVFGLVAIDLLPGPSEILIISDETGRADWIAADLVAQAEHGHGSQAVLVTPSRKLAAAVEAAVRSQLRLRLRQRHLADALENGGFIIVVRDLHHAVETANAYAPEHLTLIGRDQKRWLPRLRTAGAIFLGNHSAVAAGDYLAGPSHTLPTGGAGKSFAGLTTDQFQRRTSVVRLDPASMK
jgi:histidinol dehydrogenase